MNEGNFKRILERERELRGDVDIADFSAVGFVGLDVNPTVGIPEAYATIFAAAQAIISVAVEPSSEDGTLVPPEHVSLLRRQIGLAHLTFLPGSTLLAVLLNLAGKVIVRHWFILVPE